MYKRIRDLREDQDIKQVEIAKFLNMSQNGYSQIETGTNALQIEHLLKLAEFYHTSTDYLLGLTDEIKPYPKSNYKKEYKK